MKVKFITYLPSFKGKHNEVKSKVWLLLYERYLSGEKGLLLYEIVDMGGFSYHSVANLLCNWVRWRYVGFKNTKNGRQYYLKRRGRRWIERWQSAMPLQLYISDMEKERGRGA